MSVNREKKEELVEKLADKMKSAASFVFVDYSGMSVAQQQDLKKLLKEAGASMTVAKNTLILLAAKKAGILSDKDNLAETFSGQTAVVFGSEDPVSPIQIVGKFAKANEVLEFKAGVVEGELQDKEAVARISTLPGKEVLQSQVVGYLASPMYALASVLSSKMQSLVYILEQASKKGGE